MTKLDGNSMNIVNENIEKLKEIFPEVFSEDKIDFEKLQEELGNFTDTSNETYNFTWNGKQEAKKIAQTPSTGTLRPCKEESKNFDTTQNLYIEGDNLEVLKLLQKSYHKKVKMIYIDPPYNTGKDFVYKDNFKDNIKNYLEQTGQVDSKGNRLSTNSDTSGRYHSDWLSMMYPRLKLARNLLKDDGVIFISIDDNEINNLRKLCDEIFGEDNFVNQFIWLNNSAGRQIQGSGAATTKEYVVCYAKQINEINEFLINGEYAKEIMPDSYKGFNFEPKEDEIGKYITTHELNNGNSMFNEKTRPNLVYDIFFNPNTNEVETGSVNSTIKEGFVRISPKKITNGVNNFYAWRWSQEKVKKESYDLEFIENNSIWKVFTKRRNYSETSLKDIITNISTVKGSNELKDLHIDKIFDYPKPTEIIKIFLKTITKDTDTIVDFFSGSATTAHSLMSLNSRDNNKRKFICIQLPEETSNKEFPTICEIGKERIRRAGDKIVEESGNTDLDIGFKVLKLDSSNIKEWDSDFDNLAENLLDSVDNIKEDRTSEDLLYEILLKYGLDLTLPIEEKTINDKKVFIIGFGALVVCLDNDIDIKTVEKIAEIKEELESETMRVVFKDSSFKDAVVKTNAIQVLKQFEIDEVVSI